MSGKVKLDVQSPDSHKFNSPDETALKTNSWANHLSQFPKV
jgi:hypothetical protein